MEVVNLIDGYNRFTPLMILKDKIVFLEVFVNLTFERYFYFLFIIIKKGFQRLFHFYF